MPGRTITLQVPVDEREWHAVRTVAHRRNNELDGMQLRAEMNRLMVHMLRSRIHQLPAYRTSAGSQRCVIL